MKILVSFPGRAGDIIWMLPTARAIAEAYDTPVDLQLAGEFAGLRPLLAQQPYLGQVSADPRWGMEGSPAPVPFDLGLPHDRVFPLDYRGWPEWPLPLCPYTVAQSACAADGVQLGPLDLLRPWITLVAPPEIWAVDIAVGFTEAWFELKLGLLTEVNYSLQEALVQLTPPGSRWVGVPGYIPVEGCDWLYAAATIQRAQVFFGDCSALHVLAVALGKRCILMEPMEARHNEIFYPLGKTGPQVTLVTGNDGLPTFDARHCIDALRKALP